MTKVEIDTFEKARAQFPVTSPESGIAYLNNAATGPMSYPVKEALDNYYETTWYHSTNADIPAFADLDKIRRLGAGMIGARTDEIGFGFNTGFGLNIAAFGLPLKEGDEVLLSDKEFPSNVYPWLALRERGIKIKFIKSENGFFSIDNFKNAITDKSKVFSISFVQFFNGYKNDLTELGKICNDQGLYFVVDGIQGCGCEEINVHRSLIDIFSTGSQKWMLSPLGTGFFYVKKELQANLNTPFRSWLAVDWKLDFTDLFHYDRPVFNSAQRFEMGTYPYAHVHAMAAALEMINSLGVDSIQRHNHELLDILIDYLKADDYYRIVSNLEDNHRSSILSFTCDKAREIHRSLIKEKLICAFREGAIRVSAHLYNDESDIRQLIDKLEKYKSV